ncbi:MAG: hypothetical protein ABSH48_19125 [Verrucomicrobiota bacterium]|jgi:hypothetical protein
MRNWFFQQVVEAPRREQARNDLGQGSVELAEQACLLGRGDANPIFRAFQNLEAFLLQFPRSSED